MGQLKPICFVLGIIIHIAFQDQIKCYSCVSEPWDIFVDCEEIIPHLGTTPTAECNSKCYTYVKDYSVLIRGCFTDEEAKSFNDIYQYDKGCNTDLCNNAKAIVPWNADDGHIGKDETYKLRDCLRCASTVKKRSEPCETAIIQFRSDPVCPRRRRCTLYYKMESKEIQRNCDPFGDVVKIMNADRKEDTMILWCNFVNCNSQKLEKLTSCPEGRANSRYEGCVILKPGEIAPIVSSAINNNNTRIKKILRYIWCAFLFCCIL